MNDLPVSIEELLEQINTETIDVIAKRIKKIGKLKSEELAVIQNISRYYQEDFKTITKKLAKSYNMAVDEVERILLESAEQLGKDVKQYYEMSGNVQSDKYIKPIINSAYKNLKNDILNLSKTTALSIIFDGQVVSLKQGYMNIINKAILSIRTGTVDFYTAMQQSLKELGQGLKVQYDTGYTRRLDSSLRMNILDGVRSMNKDIRKQQGKEFGANGVYILPHGLCAPDHLPYQGKEYTYKEFEQLNNTLERPIATGQMNCGHVAYDVIVGGLNPYTDEELKEIDKYSTEKVKWNGEEMTRYEASQKMRQAETRLRELKDTKRVFKEAGDKLNTARYNKYIKNAEEKYLARCKEAGLKPQKRRY